MNIKAHPFVSVIIPTYNEEKFIVGCLESLRKLDYPPDRYEVIVVDNGSTDPTIRLCERFTQQILVRPGLTVAGLRNDGAKNARGEVLAFLDADCTADVDWMKNAVTSLELEPCVTGSWYRASPDATWVESTWCSQVQDGRKEVSHINAGNLIVSAELFRELGGFKESLRTGEDYEFCMRASRVVKIISDDTIRVVHHGNPKTVEAFFRRELWHGLGAFGSLSIEILDKPLLGTLSFFLLTTFQIVALINILLGEKPLFFYYLTSLIILLVILTVVYRKQYIKNISMAAQLFVLYYLFYLARSISLIMMIAHIDYRRSR